MSKVWAIFRREVGSYLGSPVAYVIGALFLAISAYFFSVGLFVTRQATLEPALSNMGVVFLFMAPVLTQRLLAEERRAGTDELLFTSPLRVGHVVLGKYLAALFIYLLILGSTLIFPAILLWVGEPDLGPIYTGYAGMLLLGAAYLAVGLLASALTDNQMVAGMTGFGLLLLLWVFGWAGAALGGRVGEVLAQLALMSHIDSFLRGVIDSADITFYVSFVLIVLILTTQVFEQRRWAS